MTMFPFQLPPGVPPWAWWAATAAAAAVFTALLPVGFSFRAAYRGRGRGEKAFVEFSVLGGLAVWRLVIPLFRLTRKRPAPGLTVLIGRAVGARYRTTRREAERQEKREVVTPAEIWRTVRGLGWAGGPLARCGLRLASKTYWRKLQWETTLSLPDAARTAVLTGLMWSVKAQMAALARLKLRLAPGQPTYRVTPGFDEEGSASRLDGIGVLRLGDIILAFPGLALALGRLWLARLRNRSDPQLLNASSGTKDV